MILSFSGTGNSGYVAARIADMLDDTLLRINDRIQAANTSRIKTNGRLVIVTPTYAWRMPRVVRDWLLKTEFSGVKQVWFVMTCGSEIGNAARYNRMLCMKKGFAYMGTAQVVMPENYIAMFHVPQVSEAQKIVKHAASAIDRAAACIATGQSMPCPRNNLYDRVMSGLVNPVFYTFCVQAKAFVARDTCIGCGQCVRRCPLNNILLHDGKPIWSNHCTHCMACICYCPTAAIEYGKKSCGKPRYHIEAVTGKQSELRCDTTKECKSDA